MNLYAYAGNNPVTYTDPFGLCATGGKDYEYDQCGNQTGAKDNGTDQDRHFMNLNDGRRIQIDGRPYHGSTPYNIIDDAYSLDNTAWSIASSQAADEDYTAVGAYFAGRKNGGDLDFKPDVNARVGVRTLWNAGDVGGTQMYVHNDKVANAAFSAYIHNYTMVLLSVVLRAARGQSAGVGATGENLDQLFIRRGWGLP